MATGAGIDPQQLTAAVQEHWRWKRALRSYLAGHPEPDGRTLLCFADGCGKAGQKLLRAIAESDTKTPAGRSRRNPMEDRKGNEMTTNETLEALAIDELTALAKRTDDRSRDAMQPVKIAMEVGEVLAELKSRAADAEDWRHWHTKYLPWPAGHSDFLLAMYRGLPNATHRVALQVLSAESLQQAAWLLHQSGASGEFLRLPEPREGKLLRCNAGDGAALIEVVPDATEPRLFHMAIVDRLKSPYVRRRTWGAPQGWQFATDSLSRELAQYAADSVLMFEADAESAVLTPQPEESAAD